jgi:hypothetical protein
MPHLKRGYSLLGRGTLQGVFIRPRVTYVRLALTGMKTDLMEQSRGTSTVPALKTRSTPVETEACALV